MGSQQHRSKPVRHKKSTEANWPEAIALEADQHRINNQRDRRPLFIKSKPALWVGGSLILLLVIIVGFIFVAHQSDPESKVQVVLPADAATLQKVTHVDPTLLARAGTGGVVDPVQKTRGSAAPLTGSDGKPEIFYYGAEYCPNCAAERWSLVIALSRFGTFQNLNQTTSSSIAGFPDTSTFTFRGASYTSAYLHFVPVEALDREGNVLQEPTTEQQSLVNIYDAPPYIALQDEGSYPFIDIGNRYLLLGGSFSPAFLRANSRDSHSNPLSQKEIADQLSSGNALAAAVLGTANYLTSAICASINNQPASVCNDPAIQQIEKTISQPGQAGGIGMAGSKPPMVVAGELAIWRKEGI